MRQTQLYNNEYCFQWISELHWKSCCSSWNQKAIKSHRNDSRDWHGWYDATRLPSLQTRLLDAGHVWSNQTRCYGTLMSFSHKSIQSCYTTAHSKQSSVIIHFLNNSLDSINDYGKYIHEFECLWSYEAVESIIKYSVMTQLVLFSILRHCIVHFNKHFSARLAPSICITHLFSSNLQHRGVKYHGIVSVLKKLKILKPKYHIILHSKKVRVPV